MAAGPIPSAADLAAHGAKIAAAQSKLQSTMAAVSSEVAAQRAAALAVPPAPADAQR